MRALGEILTVTTTADDVANPPSKSLRKVILDAFWGVCIQQTDAGADVAAGIWINGATTHRAEIFAGELMLQTARPCRIDPMLRRAYGG